MAPGNQKGRQQLARLYKEHGKNILAGSSAADLAVRFHVGERYVKKKLDEWGINWRVIGQQTRVRKLSSAQRQLSTQASRCHTCEWERQLARIYEVHRLLRGVSKAVVLCDPHIPHINADVIETCLQENRDADLGIWGGDVVTLDYFGRFTDYTRPLEPQQEITKARALIRDCRAVIPQWLVIEGNHEERFAKALSRWTNPERFFALQESGQIHHPITLVADGIPGVEVVNWWWAQVGDCLITHAKQGSRVQGEAASNVLEWFETKTGNKELTIPVPYSAVVQAHTHRLLQTWSKGKMICEGGCGCRSLDYMMSSKLTGGRRPYEQHTGWIVLYFDRHGRVDHTKSHLRRYLSRSSS